MRNKSFFSPIVDSVRHWYVPLIVGILFLLSAIFAFSKPLQVFVSLAVFMGISLMISGVSEVFFAFTNRQSFSQWAWHFVMGTLTFIISIMLLKDLELSFNVLALYIGLMFMFRAIAGISLSLDLKKYGIKNWWMTLILGIMGVMASIVLLMNPVIAGVSTVMLMAFIFIFIGVFQIAMAFQLRKIHKFSQRIRPELKERYKNLHTEFYDDWVEIIEED